MRILPVHLSLSFLLMLNNDSGAGWGGCTVSLVPETVVPEFIAALRKEYPLYSGLSDEQFGEAVFATPPSSGAFGETFISLTITEWHSCITLQCSRSRFKQE